MVFRPVFLNVPDPDSPLARREFEMGDSDAARLKEFQRTAIVGGSFQLQREGRKDWVFYIGRTEVTRDQWSRVMEQTEGIGNPEPKTNVSFTEINNFLDKYNAALRQDPSTRAKLPTDRGGKPGIVRLPLDAEWEFAARGGVEVTPDRFSARFPYETGKLNDHEWFAGPSSADGLVAPSGFKDPSPLGVHDMLGNVQEFVASAFELAGKVGGNTVRGGSYLTHRDRMRVTQREELPRYNDEGIAIKRPHIGFRLAIAAPIGTDLKTLQEIQDNFAKDRENEKQQVRDMVIEEAKDSANTDAAKLGQLMINSQKGDSTAQFELARANELGLMGLTPNLEEAISLYEKAAAAGKPDAQTALARLTQGTATSPRIKVARAEDLLETAEKTLADAPINDRAAQQLFAKTAAEAYQLFTEAGDAGLINRADCLWRGIGTPIDPVAAVELLNEAGNTTALQKLAEYDRELEKAKSWLEGGAKTAPHSIDFSALKYHAQQHPKLMTASVTELVRRNRAGSSNEAKPLENDPVCAFVYQHFANKVARMGDGDSLSEAGFALMRGAGVAENDNTAISYYERAWQLNNPIGAFVVGAAYLGHDARFETNVPKGMELLKTAANNELKTANWFLGFCLARGEIPPRKLKVRQDVKLAKQYLTKAISLGDIRGYDELGRLYFEAGSLQDLRRAQSLWKEGAQKGNPGCSFYLEQHGTYLESKI